MTGSPEGVLGWICCAIWDEPLKAKAAFFLLLSFLLSCPASAQVSLPVCFNYGCARQVTISVSEERLREIHDVFDDVLTAADEREAVSGAVAALYRIAATQTPIGADRAGNLRDEEANGRMDCIDHSTTTTAMLKMMEKRGWLRFHRVLPPVRRNRLIFQHFSAALEMIEGEIILLVRPDCEHARRYCKVLTLDILETGSGGERRFAVDTWYVEQGEPALVLPLNEWLSGGGLSNVW